MREVFVKCHSMCLSQIVCDNFYSAIGSIQILQLTSTFTREERDTHTNTIPSEMKKTARSTGSRRLTTRHAMFFSPIELLGRISVVELSKFRLLGCSHFQFRISAFRVSDIRVPDVRVSNVGASDLERIIRRVGCHKDHLTSSCGSPMSLLNQFVRLIKEPILQHLPVATKENKEKKIKKC